jgi:putative flippase GtrA
LNSVFGFCVYWLVFFLSEKTWLALLCGVCTGIIFNFMTTGGYAFRDRSAQRLPRFICAYFIIYLLNWGLIEVLLNWRLSPVIGQAVLTPFVAIFSYFLMTRFVFTESTQPRARSS